MGVVEEMEKMKSANFKVLPCSCLRKSLVSIMQLAMDCGENSSS